MKTGFKDALAIKEGKKIESPWNFDCPPYDERSSCYVQAGTNYGVGHRTPVGTEKVTNKSAIPYGRPNTMKVDGVYKGRPDLVEIKEE